MGGLDYNTRLVILGSGILGAVCGLVGVYLLLRKRSLIGDAICHASLPGIALGFFVSVWAGGSGRDPIYLMAGAAVTGVAGALTVLAIRRWTNLKDDAALGIVLSVFFGMGMALLSLVQQTEQGNAAGIEGFIYGNTAGIMAYDAILIAVASGIVGITIFLLRKEFQLLCFDASFAGTSVVGVLLIIAMVVTPPASARFWSDRLQWNLIVSMLIGVLAGALGATSSLVIERVPSGAAMVLYAALIFAISLVFGSKRGLLWRSLRLRTLRRQADDEHILRSMYEWLETRQMAPDRHGEVRSNAMPRQELAQLHAWGPVRFRSVVDRLIRGGWLVPLPEDVIALTASGIQQSHRAVRRHRLLEHYFARWAELSPDAIDRSADYTEHALDDELLAMLERDAMVVGGSLDTPPSIHPIG